MKNLQNMNEMNARQTYVKPDVQIYELDTESAILAGSVDSVILDLDNDDPWTSID